MLRRLIGSMLLLLGILILASGFYTPAHKNIHAQRFQLSEFVLQGAVWLGEQSWGAPMIKRVGAERTGTWLPVTVYQCGSEAECARLCEASQWPLTDAENRQYKLDEYRRQLADLALPNQGQIIVSGSSTLFKFSRHIAQCYVYETLARTGEVAVDGSQSNLAIKLTSVGTTGNLTRFCDGTEDLRNASDEITVEMLAAACPTTHQKVVDQLVPIRVVRDAITIAVNRQHAAAQSQSLLDVDLRRILTDATRWSQVDTAWPQDDILRFYPSSSSGTRRVLARTIFDENIPPLDQTSNVRPHENDSWAAKQIVENINAVGYFGFTYYAEYSDLLVSLPVNGVRPEALWFDEEYPLQRPLYLYTTKDKLCTNPLLVDFLHYYLLARETYVGALGYFPLAQTTINAANDTIDTRTEFDALLDTLRDEQGGDCVGLQ